MLPTAEVGLELPLDVPRTATTRFVRASYAFAIAARSDAATMAAAFAIQLARYNGQASIPITAGTRHLVLPTPDGATAGAVVREAAAQLAAPPTSTTSDGGRVAISEDRADESLEADLQLVWSASGAASFVYNASLFAPETIVRFAGHLQTLVAGLEPCRTLAELPLLAPGERAWLDNLATGATSAAWIAPVYRRVEAFAHDTPDAIAVRYRDRTLTYAELDRRANRLAARLIELGAAAETRVVVCVEPSFDIAIAMLAIWKAGAVYVPLDPTYPAARVAVILDDTRPVVVITKTALVDKLGFTGHPTLALDTASLPESASSQRPDVALADTAYIYYTSGTTGKPKGVMASHANLVTYVQVAQDRYAITSAEVMPAIARFSFSISMFELMSPLAAGGTLVVLDREQVLDPARLVRALAETTLFHAGPSLLKSVIAYVHREKLDVAMFDGVRHASSGGDLIAPEVLRALVAMFRNAEVFVIYGCSEIACMGCTYPVPRDRPIERTYVGRPFDNVVTRVLDRARNPVPAGVAGEIWFAGGGVAKGYLDRPELTAEKFVDWGGQRFYRTGDLGRISNDGWIEILGRNDFQIKIRGMRIELAEVEYNLRKAPGVKDGVVVARTTANGERALVAYVVLERNDDDSRRVAMTGIRRHMIDSVPDYMVPASYVDLPALPINHNMKVDRNALPDLVRADDRAAAPAGREPQSESELQLAAIWRRLLGVEQVRLDDNYFELGGDSLVAMELVASIEVEMGVVIDGLEILRETLEVMAVICDRRLGRTSPVRTREAAAAPALDAFMFGGGGELYGVLHGALAPGSDTAALIVAPPTHDRLRAHFVIGQLARQLVARGVPAMAFDLYGCWDAMGDAIDATVPRWTRDIEVAATELARRTGATRIVGIGVRLGAPLLCAAAPRLGLSRMVLWDPVDDGASWYAEQAAMHKLYLRGMQHLRQGKAPRAIAGGEELIGMTYATSTLRELRALILAPPAGVPLSWLATSAVASQRAAHARLGRGTIATLEAAALSWGDIARLDDLLPDLGISRALAAMVVAP